MKKVLLIFLTIILVSTTHAYGFKFMAGGHLAKYAVEPEVVGEDMYKDPLDPDASLKTKALVVIVGIKI